MMRFVLAAAAFLAAAPLQAAVEIEEVTSPGGIKAWLVEEHSIPFTALELRFRGGASLDAEGERGAINLMMALLEEGAGDMDAQAFSVAVEGLAADFRFNAYPDTASVSARFLTENRDEAVALLRAALVEPRFDPEAIERVRGQVIANIQSNDRDPDELSSGTFASDAFGDHPYGKRLEGTEESVRALTRDDIVAAKDRVLARDRVYVSAVGDIDAETLGTLLDDLLGDLPETGAPMPEPVAFGAEPGVHVVDFPTPQSVITFGHRGISRDDPDFFPAYILMQELGGSGFNSRLMEEVREKRGLTYGIAAYLVPRDFSDAIMGRVSTVNARVGETIDVIREEWRRMAEEGMTPEQLEAAQVYLTGAYPLRFDGNGQIADILVGMQLDGLDTDYVNTRNDKIEAVTVEDIARVAQRIILPEELHFVVVGQPEGLDASN